MKNYYLISLMVVILFISCDDNISPPDDDNCEFPQGWCDDGFWIDKVYPGFSSFGRSYDNKKLSLIHAWEWLYIYNLENNELEYINLSEIIPDSIHFNLGFPYWSPYNSNKLIVSGLCYIDSTGDGRSDYESSLSFLIDLDSKSSTLIYPPKLNIVEFGTVQKWLPGSTEGNDSLLVRNWELYLPQQEKLFNLPTDFKFPYTISPDQKYTLTVNYIDALKKYELFVNGKKLNISDKFSYDYSSWSPDSKKLCVSVYIEDAEKPCRERRYSENWIIDIEDILNNNGGELKKKVINQKEEFCMFSYGGGNAEFITDNSLAITMFNADENFATLWEVSIEGELIRKLATVP